VWWARRMPCNDSARLTDGPFGRGRPKPLATPPCNDTWGDLGVPEVEQAPFGVSGTSPIWGKMASGTAAYRGEMRAPKKKPTAEKLRPWRVALMRSRTHYLGVVYAADEKSSEAAAVAEFKIGDEQRRRLVVREQD
jgi:hypothetical protein